MKQITEQLLKYPTLVFLMDGLGALLSAMLLGVILTQYQPYFGMPVETLRLLAILPCLFFFYDLVCYLFLSGNYSLLIKIIVGFNLSYCMISAICLVIHFHQLTILGYIYFFSELAIILILTYLEFRVASKLSGDQF